MLVGLIAVAGQGLLPGERDTKGARALFLAGLAALVVFACVFPEEIASIRGGPRGVAAGYSRTALEYVGDIGKGGTIRRLFGDYVELFPSLSLHSQVHPPGPVAALWVLSWVVGRDPYALSLATIVVGALAVIPLFLWAREMTNQRTAWTCVLLYVLMPSIVLFTATSVDILFTPCSILTLFLFERALRRASPAHAIAAGLCFAAASLLSFNLLCLGAYFACAALAYVWREGTWKPVLLTAAPMLAASVALHVAIYLWSGFNVIQCFHECKAHLDTHQAALIAAGVPDSPWLWRLLNPACLFYFAGIPVSLLLIGRLARTEPATKALFLAMLITLLALNALYLAQGEGRTNRHVHAALHSASRRAPA